MNQSLDLAELRRVAEAYRKTHGRVQCDEFHDAVTPDAVLALLDAHDAAVEMRKEIDDFAAGYDEVPHSCEAFDAALAGLKP